MTDQPLYLNPRTIPISLLKEDNLVPTCYIIHVHEQVCTNCGMIEHYSRPYAKNDLRSRATNQPIEHLVAITYFRYNLPIYSMALPPSFVHCCVNCAGKISLSHMPPAPKKETPEWNQTLARKYAETPESDKPKSPPKRPMSNVKTLDDLFNKFDF